MDDAAKAQDDVLAFLAKPAAYGGNAEKIRRIDTHAASVFLAGDRVLKVKRAVHFPFLDFSTLEKRKHACEAEVEVNRRLASNLYRGVVAITRAGDGRLAIDGDGEPVEWAVDMVRFDENRTLDHMANDIDDDLADALGRAVAAAMHGRRRPVRHRQDAACAGAGAAYRADASDADAAVVQTQESYELGALTWPKIDASGTLAETLGRARAALSADPQSG